MVERIRELVELINKANEEYYGNDNEIMSNAEWDALMDELRELEEKEGIVLSNSPTQSVGHSIASKLEKKAHEAQMLSLDKTKEIRDLESFLGIYEGLLSFKLDGLTIVLTYENGELKEALTRGDGAMGEVITQNVKAFKNIPLSIKHKEKMTIRGEAIIKYSDFEKLNQKLGVESQYKNPRNLCSGTVRQLNSKIVEERSVYFYAFQIVGYQKTNQKEDQYKLLKNLGFETVEYTLTSSLTVGEDVVDFKKKLQYYDLPSDGLVLTYNDIEFSKSLGVTSKFPRDSIAFKWQDELVRTSLLRVDWNASRTGLINPVAIFTPVEIEGTTVERASIHNVSILKGLKLGIGDELLVYKANMIIPQIKENKTQSGTVEIPTVCPACSLGTRVKKNHNTEELYCTNPNCPAKIVQSIVHFVGRNAMNIEGVSEATIEKFIEQGIIREAQDLYDLHKHKEAIVKLEGFGEKSYENIIASIEKSRKVKLAYLINALGIPGIGLANAKVLARTYHFNLRDIMEALEMELIKIDGFGEILAQNVYRYFRDPQNRVRVEELKKRVEIEKEEKRIIQNEYITGKTFVITGELTSFENRDELKEKIEALGGKVTGSVTKKTDYLINNDMDSGSTKNKKAKELGVPILSEEEIRRMLTQESLDNFLQKE